MSFLNTKSDDKALNLWMYEKMWAIRIFEENANQLYLSAKMPGLTHLYIGQEAVATGACSCLEASDYITSTHRGHGHCVAKGAKFKEMFSELLGKKSGYCLGKGGSMHIADQENGNLGANAIVGGSIGIATGAGLSAKMQNNDNVTVCFIGEGAIGQGLFFECVNMASLWNLPVIYLCENNLYSEYTHFTEITAGDLYTRCDTFGVKSKRVNGQDAQEVHKALSECIKGCKEGKGPYFVVCDTYRYHGHHVGDINRTYYRSKGEEKDWRDKDPIAILEKKILKKKLADKKELKAIEDRLRKEAEEAVEFALNDDYPDISQVTTHVYKS